MSAPGARDKVAEAVEQGTAIGGAGDTPDHLQQMVAVAMMPQQSSATSTARSIAQLGSATLGLKLVVADVLRHDAHGATCHANVKPAKSASTPVVWGGPSPNSPDCVLLLLVISLSQVIQTILSKCLIDKDATRKPRTALLASLETFSIA